MTFLNGPKLLILNEITPQFLVLVLVCSRLLCANPTITEHYALETKTFSNDLGWRPWWPSYILMSTVSRTPHDIGKLSWKWNIFYCYLYYSRSLLITCKHGNNIKHCLIKINTFSSRFQILLSWVIYENNHWIIILHSKHFSDFFIFISGNFNQH